MSRQDLVGFQAQEVWCCPENLPAILQNFEKPENHPSLLSDYLCQRIDRKSPTKPKIGRMLMMHCHSLLCDTLLQRCRGLLHLNRNNQERNHERPRKRLLKLKKLQMLRKKKMVEYMHHYGKFGHSEHSRRLESEDVYHCSSTQGAQSYFLHNYQNEFLECIQQRHDNVLGLCPSVRTLDPHRSLYTGQ